MTDKVEVVYFPKLCPYCGVPLRHEKKVYVTWLECRNEQCPFLINNPDPYETCRNSR